MKTAYFYIISLLSYLLLASIGYARSWQAQKDINVELRLSSSYDNNILRLSDSDIDQFKENNLGWKTSPSTYDDLVNDIGLALSFTSPKILDRKTRIYYTASYKSFAKNDYNDRLSHSVFFTQDLTKRLDLLGSYFFIPERYLRDYYDRDLGDVYATEFDYHLGSIGFRYIHSKKWRIEARYEGFQVYYNPKFTEYDSEGWGIKLAGRYSIQDDLDINLEFRRRWSDNVGYEESSSLAEVDPEVDAEYGDGSYGEEWFEYGFSYDTPHIIGISWDMNVSHRIRHRFYTSSLPFAEDSYHRGREHMHHLLSFSLMGELLKGIELGPEFAYEWRRTDSPKNRVHEVKDFDDFVVGLNIRYEIW